MGYAKFDTFLEIIISRATSGERWEIELNSGSLPPIPGELATLSPTSCSPDISVKIDIVQISRFPDNEDNYETLFKTSRSLGRHTKLYAK